MEAPSRPVGLSTTRRSNDQDTLRAIRGGQVADASTAAIVPPMYAARIFALAQSLGGVESLIGHPAIMTHAIVAPGTRAKLGIGDSLVRLSVGVEDVVGLRDDLAQAMAAV